MGEVRYLSVKKAYPNEAQELFDAAEKWQNFVTKVTFARARKIGAKMLNTDL